MCLQRRNSGIVSVIMGVYNAERYIKESIQSIQTQTYPLWELVVVNDASIDNSRDIISTISNRDNRVKLINNKINIGLAACLNRALDATTGGFIARMDADDIALPERLEKQVAFLQRHSEIDVVGSLAIEIDSDGNLGCLMPRRRTHEELMRYIYTESPLYHPTVMARQRFYEAMKGYDSRLLRAQDYDLWLRGYERFRYHNLQEPLVYYRRTTRPNWRNAMYSARVILSAIRRDRKPPYFIWFALRPLLSCLLRKTHFK